MSRTSIRAILVAAVAWSSAAPLGVLADGRATMVAQRPVSPEAVEPETEQPPAGLTGEEWNQIRQSIRDSEYHPRPITETGEAPSLQASNRQQAYRTIFRRDGIEIVPQVPARTPWRLGLAVTGYGYEDDLRPVAHADPHAEKERVEYRRGPVTEWYVNRSGGLEQGFDLQEPTPRRDAALVIAMAITGDLDVRTDGAAVSLTGASGETLLRYAGLKAWDADRRPLTARMEAADREVRIVVDARAARFPVTVDPTFSHEAQLSGHGDPIREFGANFGVSALAGDTLLVGEPSRNRPGALDAGSAYVFVRVGSTWTQQQTLVASDGSTGDGFGGSVAVDGDTAVIGAFGDDTAGGADAGSAYVFVRVGTVWAQQQKLVATDGAAGDAFGAVSLSGDTVVVGAAGAAPAGNDSGSAYVFVRSGTNWTQQQKLQPLDGAPNDHFGWSVSVDGQMASVGAVGSNAFRGAVYVFVRSATTWSQEQKLVAADGAADHQLGRAVSLSGDTAVASAIGANFGRGAAYVFVRSGGTWSQQQRLIASDPVAGSYFGQSVSLWGDTAAVGAPRIVGVTEGATYVFVRSGANWAQEQKIVNGPFSPDGYFGFSVSVFGDTLAAGAEADFLPALGSAHVFVRSGGVWTRQQSLLPLEGNLSGDGFGTSVSLSGNVTVIGAAGDAFGAPLSGSASVFERSGTTWTERAKLKGDLTSANDGLGTSVSVSGNWIVAGAPMDDDAQGGTDSGAAYTYTLTSTWDPGPVLRASDRAANDLFGFAVSLSGDTVVVGAPGDDVNGNPEVGSAYVFVRTGTGGTWTQQQKLVATGGVAVDKFGSAVSIDGNTAVVGMPLADAGGGTIQDAGAAVVFVRSGTTWTVQQTLFASDPADADNFGQAVSISGDTLVVGSILDDTSATDRGSAYVFVRSGTVWTQQQKLLASDGGTNDNFGASVSVSGDEIAVGAAGDTTSAGTFAGSAYLFTRSGTSWTQRQKLLAPDAAANDFFGNAVAIAGDTVVIGASRDDRPAGVDAGSAHVFRFVGVADVGLSISDSPDPVPAGSDLVYTISVSNAGPEPASGVQVGLPTPPGLVFVSNAGACTTPFPCAVGTLASGQMVMIMARYHVPLGYSGPNPVTATASATATSSDPVTTNNQASAMTTVAAASADLQVTKTGPASVMAGANVVYTITVQNAGPSDAAGVEVADPTPAGLIFVSNTGSCTTPFPCALGTVPRTQTRVITSTFNVPVGYGGPNPIANQATVSSTTADPDTSNNTAQAMTQVLVASLEPASLDVDAPGNRVFQPNEIVLVAPSWRNGGTAVAANVTGAATAFGGPPGPAYTTHDAAAAYGTIAVGATASCGADCYVFGNTAATRPALHWDGEFVETLAPGGMSKTWTLHIGDSFADAPPTSAFYRFIETLLHHDVTGGCAASAYCPSTPTTREAMAVFVLRSDDPSAPPPPACVAGSEAFDDVPASSGFCRWVEELARRGVVGGCGGGNYCPSSPATREQMAVFVLRTVDPTLTPPPCVAGSEAFADVPASSGFCRWIEELARRGVVTGCGNGNYCPSSTVTREQMSVFLGVTFGLTLYGP